MNELEIYQFNNFESQENDNFLIGSFESFHLGHYQLYKEALKYPGRKILVTFNQDTFEFKNKAKYFQSNKANYFNLAQLDLDCIVELDFHQVRYLNAVEFLVKLTKKKRAKIFVGEDFSFGSDLVKAANLVLEHDFNFTLIALPIFKLKNQKISTGFLKESLEFGDLELINNLLVYNFTFEAIFNQTNLEINPKQLLPHPGIYLSILFLNDLAYLSLTHINLAKGASIILLTNEVDYSNELTKIQCYIELIKKQRLIISSSQDQITNEDIENTKKYLVNQ